MGLIPGVDLGSVNLIGYVSQIIYWLFYGLLILFVLGFLGGLYYYLSFRIKATIFPLYGSGKDGIFSVGKRKWNRVKWIKNKNCWRALLPPFNKKNIEPFDSEYIYPGRQIYVYDLNGDWFPGRHNIAIDEKKIRAEISPIPYWIRNWQALEHKQNAIDFAKHDFWSENKVFIWLVICVAICCVLCGSTVYFTYKFAAGGTASMDRLAAVIQGMTEIAGKPLG